MRKNGDVTIRVICFNQQGWSDTRCWNGLKIIARFVSTTAKKAAKEKPSKKNK